MENSYLIVGAGIIGMSIAYELKKNNPNLKITIIEKEHDVGLHASGRNSGVLHAGFYYTEDSLKAKFTLDGNRLMRDFCQENRIHVNECHKVVVAQNSNEVKTIHQLLERGKKNSVPVELITPERLKEIDPNAKTCEVALYSPLTATVDPKAVCQKLKEILISLGVKILFNTPFNQEKHNGFIINCAGLYADKIAKHFNLGKKYTIIPFKGSYLKYMGNHDLIKTNIYPVPNLANPFLGVHFTITHDNSIKIGPTAIPTLYREHYQALKGFKIGEFLEIFSLETKLFLKNSFNFRNLAINEIKKYRKPYFINLAQSLVHNLNPNKFSNKLPSGIRAQLFNKETNELVQDFVIEKGKNSLHVLNAVSPAFTCSFAFAKHVVTQL